MISKTLDLLGRNVKDLITSETGAVVAVSFDVHGGVNVTYMPSHGGAITVGRSRVEMAPGVRVLSNPHEMTEVNTPEVPKAPEVDTSKW